MKLYRVFFFNVTEIHYRVLPSFFYKFLNFDFSAEWSADRPWWMRRLPWGIAHDCLICIRSPVCKSGHPFCDWLAGGRRGARRNKKGRSQKPPPKKQKKSETRSRIDCFFHFLSPPQKESNFKNWNDHHSRQDATALPANYRAPWLAGGTNN